MEIPPELVERLGPDAMVAVLTGAGVSAASGIATFRGAHGLWKRHRVEDLATPEAFARQPDVVWGWYAWRRDQVRAASPNPAHRALAALADRVARLDIITQNVDGLHERCGLAPPGRIIRLHGSLWTLRCTVCGAEREDHGPGPASGDLPRCACGGLERPGVVWFGEVLAMGDLQRAGVAASRAGIFLVVGTSALVYPAAGFIDLAARSGALVAEFNLEPTGHPGVAVRVAGPCEETLPRLVQALG
jgi:NAD-dependent deacetylase